MKKILIVLAVLGILSGALFAFSFELGVGIETLPVANSTLLPTVSLGAILPIGDNFGITGQANYIFPLELMGLAGIRYTFGTPKDTMRFFIGADAGVLDLVGRLLPIGGINGGLNLSVGSLSFYGKTALRLALYNYSDGIVLIPSFNTAPGPIPLFELIGGVMFNF